MTDETALGLRELCAALADELETDVASAAAETDVYARGATEFARVSADAVELRLPPDIVDAALRTPDTGSTEGRPSWIRFEPGAGARYVEDRVSAWFTTAWRHAGEADE